MCTLLISLTCEAVLATVWCSIFKVLGSHRLVLHKYFSELLKGLRYLHVWLTTSRRKTFTVGDESIALEFVYIKMLKMTLLSPLSSHLPFPSSPLLSLSPLSSPSPGTPGRMAARATLQPSLRGRWRWWQWPGLRSSSAHASLPLHPLPPSRRTPAAVQAARLQSPAGE